MVVTVGIIGPARSGRRPGERLTAQLFGFMCEAARDALGQWQLTCHLVHLASGGRPCRRSTVPAGVLDALVVLARWRPSFSIGGTGHTLTRCGGARTIHCRRRSTAVALYRRVSSRRAIRCERRGRRIPTAATLERRPPTGNHPWMPAVRPGRWSLGPALKRWLFTVGPGRWLFTIDPGRWPFTVGTGRRLFTIDPGRWLFTVGPGRWLFTIGPGGWRFDGGGPPFRRPKASFFNRAPHREWGEASAPWHRDTDTTALGIDRADRDGSALCFDFTEPNGRIRGFDPLFAVPICARRGRINGLGHWGCRLAHKSRADRAFSAAVGRSSLAEIDRAADLGARLDWSPTGGGFHRRNSKLAAACDYIIAFSWSDGDAPGDGGTADTWRKATAHLPASRCLHIPSRRCPRPSVRNFSLSVDPYVAMRFSVNGG